MKNRLIPIGNGICFFCFLFMGCSTPPGKINPTSYLVEIKGMQFQPSELLVEKGDTVVFINKDMMVHDVTEANNKTWASSPLAAGQSYSLIVTGGAAYYCTFHPVMKGKLLLH